MRLLDHGEGRRTILLITDGDNTIKDPLFTPLQTAQLARDKEVAIHTVGIGSDNPFTLERMPTIRFNTRTLEQIAETAKGRFFRAKDTSGFQDVMDTIDALESTTRTRPALIYMRDLFPTIPARRSLLPVRSHSFFGTRCCWKFHELSFHPPAVLDRTGPAAGGDRRALAGPPATHRPAPPDRRQRPLGVGFQCVRVSSGVCCKFPCSAPWCWWRLRCFARPAA